MYNKKDIDMDALRSCVLPLLKAIEPISISWDHLGPYLLRFSSDEHTLDDLTTWDLLQLAAELSCFIDEPTNQNQISNLQWEAS
jgi:hypothetical protein